MRARGLGIRGDSASSAGLVVLVSFIKTVGLPAPLAAVVVRSSSKELEEEQVSGHM